MFLWKLQNLFFIKLNMCVVCFELSILMNVIKLHLHCFISWKKKENIHVRLNFWTVEHVLTRYLYHLDDVSISHDSDWPFFLWLILMIREHFSNLFSKKKFWKLCFYLFFYNSYSFEVINFSNSFFFFFLPDRN